ncbi:uncharacterized protein [Amphiura filiformis]|uniref:uncharacterized protein n=1 Tax=Amphiura filiformis TaxID=82378 RepID=UPI003B21CE59
MQINTMTFLRQVQISGYRVVPCVSNVISKNVMPNSAPLVVQKSRTITTATLHCGTPWSHSHRCHCIYKTVDSMTAASQRLQQSIACRAYATSRTDNSEQPQRRVYKLMKIKAKDFEKVNPDTYFEGLEPSMIQAKFEESKELEDANEMVKKLFSLEVANQRQIFEKQVKVLNKKVQLDPENENTYAMLVVKQTALIRSFSRRLQTYQHRKDVGSKVKLVHLIDKRRIMLKRLRKQNYAQFEKVKKELGIDYCQFGRYDYYPLTKRMREKEEIIKESRQQRMAALKEYMETKRRPQLLLEIAQLKRDLGKELTDEEQERLRQSEEMNRDKK